MSEIKDQSKFLHAAEALVKIIEEIDSSEEYKRIWEIAFIHSNGRQYEGKTWTKELENLKKQIELAKR